MVKINSHRARDRVTSALGCAPQSFWHSLTAPHGYLVPIDHIPDLLKIKGVSKIADKKRPWHRTWSFKDY